MLGKAKALLHKAVNAHRESTGTPSTIYTHSKQLSVAHLNIHL